MKKYEGITLHAEWVTYMDAYRLYDPKYPEWTVAYIDSTEDLLEAEEFYGYTIVVV